MTSLNFSLWHNFHTIRSQMKSSSSLLLSTELILLYTFTVSALSLIAMTHFTCTKTWILQVAAQFARPTRQKAQSQHPVAKLRESNTLENSQQPLGKFDFGQSAGSAHSLMPNRLTLNPMTSRRFKSYIKKTVIAKVQRERISLTYAQMHHIRQRYLERQLLCPRYWCTVALLMKMTITWPLGRKRKVRRF